MTWILLGLIAVIAVPLFYNLDADARERDRERLQEINDRLQHQIEMNNARFEAAERFGLD